MCLLPLNLLSQLAVRLVRLTNQQLHCKILPKCSKMHIFNYIIPQKRNTCNTKFYNSVLFDSARKINNFSWLYYNTTNYCFVPFYCRLLQQSFASVAIALEFLKGEKLLFGVIYPNIKRIFIDYCDLQHSFASLPSNKTSVVGKCDSIFNFIHKTSNLSAIFENNFSACSSI